VTRDLHGKRILIVEDEYLIARQVRRAIEASGGTVAGVVGTVADALRIVDADPAIDAAVLDVNLGGERITPVAQRLADTGVPFLFSSGYEQAEFVSAFGHAPHLRKPTTAPQLIAGLIAVLAADGATGDDR